MKKTTKIILFSILFCYLFASVGCKSKTDFTPYADGTYTAEEGHSHSHEHEHDHEDEHELEHDHEDEHEHEHDDDDD